MKRFLIFLGILFSSVFITSNVNAEYYTDGTVTYDYNFLKVLISEQYNLNLDDYNYFVSRTVVYDANYSNVTPQIQFMFWSGSEPCIEKIGDDDTLYVLSETYDSVYYGSIVLKNNDNYVVSLYSGTGYYKDGFPIVLKRFTKFQDDDLYYSALASSVKGFNKLTFNDKTYDLDNLLSDKVVSDDDIYNNYVVVTEDIEKVIVRFDISKELSDFTLSLSAKSVKGSFGHFGEPYLSKTFFDSDSNKKIDITPFSYLTRDSIISTLNTGILNEAFKDSIKNKKNAIYEKWKDFINDPSEEKWKKYGNSFYKSDLDVNHYDLMYEEYKNLINGNYCTNDNYYTDFNYTFLSDVNYSDLSVEINTSNYVGDLDLKILSNLSYTIDYVYKDSSKNYLKTIDMSDYAALVLIPKVYNFDDSSSTSIMSDIYLKGTYDIELWKDIETKEQLYRYTNYNRNVFSHYFHREYKDEILYFIKKENKQTEKTITFDTRYYNYATKITLTGEIEIVNPNTGETVTVPDISSLYEYESGQEELNNSFNFFIKPIKFIFESITDFYNNYCPVVVQKFFFFVFIMTVCLVLIRIFL